MRRWIALFSISALAACNHALRSLAPPPDDGYVHLQTSGTYQCAGQAYSLDGNRTRTILEGACTRVRITGSRNDVTVYVVPAATLDAMGSRNSIVYRLIGPGRQPMLLNESESNTYYRNSRARGDQDHDWWQAPR